MGEEERRRALKLSRREVEGTGGRHGKELEEDDLDLASARFAGGEEPIIQLTGSLGTSAYRSSEDNLQEARKRSLLEPGREQKQKDQGEGTNRISSPSGALIRASTNLPVSPRAPAKIHKIAQSLAPPSPSIMAMDPIIPQGTRGTYARSIHRVKPPKSVGAEAGKYQNCYVMEGPREENPSSRSPAPNM